ncbi:MAG: transcription-repair coupling factor [Thermoleophilia bacterium]|nr:transcription-repair coupling factor [Thermoleophilia bacterium]
MYSSFIKSSEPFKKLLDALALGPARVYAPTFFQGYLLAALREEAWPGKPLVVAAPGAADADRLAADINAFSGGPAGAPPVRLLPARGALIGSAAIPSATVAGLRHAALSLLKSESPGVVVADVAALLERALLPDLWPDPLALDTGGRGGKQGFDAVIAMIAALGYERVPQVEDPGQFAVRGGIIDVFPSTDRSPVRLEYWGDELESIRRFSPFTQRSHASEQQVLIFTAGEPDEAALGALSAGASGRQAAAAGKAATAGAAPTGRPRAVVSGRPVCLVDPLQAGEVVASLWEDAVEANGEADAGRYYFKPEDLTARLESGTAAILESLPGGQPHVFTASGFKSASRKPVDAGSRLRRMAGEGLRVFVHFSSEGAARRAEHSMEGKAEYLAPGQTPPEKPGAWLVAAPPPEGFISKELRLAVFPDRSLLRPGRSSRSQSLAFAGRAIMSFRDLTPGDYVVHEDHGIGIFESVQTKTVAGVNRDYLHLRFRGEDRLFVPHDQIDKVSRYVGAFAGAPPLNKLGGRAWAQARARARGAAREMAGELLQLYAVRQSLPGHAFGPDDQWQMELEAAFPYIETPDQVAAIEDVKDDMESPHPMDRLICGDVGYGKTEVALRSAFKAVAQGKQVLMLVPTTILAMQHYQTFSTRYEKYPVVVEMISRFRTPAESRRLAAGFRDGKIDMLIGTHRLLSADIIPGDLGLVILDEEQRFGVAQKEALRQLKLKVDVLSLSATPIPRTLQMSLSGIRDISVMETPPAGRYPIRTFVGEYDDEAVRQAVMRERERGGQVFFLHNRVETIEEKADELRRLLPDARFVVAHGQMPERRLESVMAEFLREEADVLVCTSIIESGLDIPTANTLIVDRADALGLAQLYQIRGRIGRSDVVAHAYLFYPPYAELTHEARARLSTLSDYSELGSGFRIAMRDLEIRGAGNLLGDEQSGHVAAVGFDMYCDLLRQAVAELKNQPVDEFRLARLDVDTNAYIPAGYIPLEKARIDVHHRIAAARDESSLGEIRAELADRSGPMPEVVGNLLDMQEIRLRAGVIGAAGISFRNGRLALSGIILGPEQREALEASGARFAYYPQRRLLALWPEDPEAGLIVVKSVLDVIIGSLLTPAANL